MPTTTETTVAKFTVTNADKFASPSHVADAAVKLWPDAEANQYTSAKRRNWVLLVMVYGILAETARLLTEQAITDYVKVMKEAKKQGGTFKVKNGAKDTINAAEAIKSSGMSATSALRIMAATQWFDGAMKQGHEVAKCKMVLLPLLSEYVAMIEASIEA